MSTRSGHRRLSRLLALSLAATVLTACGSGSTPAGPDSGTAATATGISPELIAAAQREGGVVLYAGGHQQQTLELLQQRMQQLFGVQLTFNRQDSGAIANAVAAELASGSLNADVVSLTDPATMSTWAAEGILADVELANAADIIDGLDDPATPQVPHGLSPLGIMYNSANTDEARLPKTWEDLASQDAGTIVSADPNASGTALSFYTMIDKLAGDAFLNQFAQRDAIVTDSSLALAQLVLTGEADIGVPAIESAVLAAAAEGEPLAIAFMDDGVPTFTSELAMLAAAPRPNAAELLVQYHLSPEFQAELAEQGGRSVLEGAPQPTGAADLSGATLLSTTPKEIGDRGAAVADLFAQAFRR